MNIIQANPAQVAGATRSAETQGVTNSSQTNDFGNSDSSVNNFGIFFTIVLALIGFGLMTIGLKETFFKNTPTNENK